MFIEQIIENNQNGFGFRSYLGLNGIIQSELTDTFFVEKAGILESVNDKKMVLLEGQPGSGKSEIIESLTKDCFNNQAPFFSLKVHINGGKGEGIKNIVSQFDEYLEHTRKYTGMILLDNCDYVGYRGHRSVKRAEEYSSDFVDFLHRLMNPEVLEHNRLIATAHTDSWRDGQWQWPKDSLVLTNANETMDLFKDYRFRFLGKILLKDFVSTLIRRGLSEDAAHLTALDLDAAGLTDYSHAKLLNLELLENNELDEAVNEFNEGRLKRMLGRKNSTD